MSDIKFCVCVFFFSSRRRHTRFDCDWSSDVCSSDLGKWNINKRTLGDYFPRPSLVSHIQQPFTATDTLGAFDVRALVRGGGVTGQAGALRLAIGRALCLADERHRKKLREQGLLARDPPAVERQKPGRSGEHTSELQAQSKLVCPLLLEKKK